MRELRNRTANRRTRAIQGKFLVLAALSIVFTLALTFATLELPRIVNSILGAYFPDVPTEMARGVQQPQIAMVETLMNYARPAGYVLLGIVIVLVIVGFATKRKSLSFLGTFAFFLPVFGYFAASMFILAGIGILRLMWLPFWDVSPAILNLGDIVYLPYAIVLYLLTAVLGAKVASSLSDFLAYLAIAIGLLVFCLGTFTWLYAKLEGKKTFDFWAYRYSRHPQYFGFILWSYGVDLVARFSYNPFWVRQPGPSFLWLVSALLIICLALNEEVVMVKRTGKSYRSYQRRTPFMLPLPNVLARLSTTPIRAILKKKLPETGTEICYTFVIYSGILVFLSAVLIAFEGPLFELRLQ
jgi:protein-S-isoprenylcysteine O-methyltransferase Ste14